jgi:hydroxymethylglutaryl-CoA synthase
MYTASIFMALLSALQTSFNENEDLTGKEIGFWLTEVVQNQKFL